MLAGDVSVYGTMLAKSAVALAADLFSLAMRWSVYRMAVHAIWGNMHTWAEQVLCM